MKATSDARLLGPVSLTARQARWFLVAMHAPYVAFTPSMVSTGLDLFPADNGVVALPLVFLAGGLQLWHSLATSRGVRPRYWLLTLLLLGAVAWVPNSAFGTRWFSMQWYFAASAAMLLPPRPGLAAVAAIARSCFCYWITAST
jgi:hypothetical protein